MNLSDLPPDMRKQAEAKLAPKLVLKHTQQMNKTEAAFFARLQAERFTNIHYESMKFRLAEKCWYTPDFTAEGERGICCFEVKGGFVRDDAVVKFKVARQLYPHIHWEMWQLTRAGWSRIR